MTKKYIKSKVFNYLRYFSFALLLACLLIVCPAYKMVNSKAVVQTIIPIERPRDVWAFRSVLDQRPRMLTIALNKDLWIAYSTQTASLYKAWTGKVNGKIFTDDAGQPTSIGITHLEELDGNPWRIITSSGKEFTPEVRYKGHTILKDKISITYLLNYKGKNITIVETPEFFKIGEKVGFIRTYAVSAIPVGMNVLLKMQLNSLLSSRDITTNGTFKVTKKRTEILAGKQFLVINGGLQLKNKGTTSFALAFTSRPVMAKVEKTLTNEQVTLALISKTDCNTCHNKEVKTVGPAYRSIAQKYEKTPAMIEQLVNKVIKGGSGSWGQVPMSPHPDLPKEDVHKIVTYILGLGDAKKPTPNKLPVTNYVAKPEPIKISALKTNTIMPGIAINAYQFKDHLYGFEEINTKMKPFFSGSVSSINLQKNDFGDLNENFILHATGFITVNKTDKIVFRLVNDRGAKLILDNKTIIENIGNWAIGENEVMLSAGRHSFKIEYFQRGGSKVLSFQWRPQGAKDFEVVPPDVFSFNTNDIKEVPEVLKLEQFAGDTYPLNAVHPAFDLAQARPTGFSPRVGAMDFLPDGRLVISTWDSVGAVYVLDGIRGNDPEKIKVKRIAFGLSEVLGIKVVDNDIYVLQKQELIKLVDLDKDGITDKYQTVCNGWEVSDNFHEFSFGLLYKDGYFYATFGTDLKPGGATAPIQTSSRGMVIKISKKDGSFSYIASGLRTPNGIGFGPDNEIFIADNQGDWLPANKIIHLQKGAWYGSRAHFKETEGLKATPPVVYLPEDEIANSPSQPVVLNKGIYQNQLIFGDVTYGGIQRVFMEKIKGVYQGAVFKFSQGLECGVNRLIWDSDGKLYVGGCGQKGGWAQTGKFPYGLQKLTFNNNIPFEMLAVRAKPNGIEIEFTKPLKSGAGADLTDYMVRQWWYKPTSNYGGPKMDEEELPVKKCTISADRKRVFLELEGIKTDHVVYIRLNRNEIISNADKPLWTTEAWYTMNNIPNKNN